MRCARAIRRMLRDQRVLRKRHKRISVLVQQSVQVGNDVSRSLDAYVTGGAQVKP